MLPKALLLLLLLAITPAAALPRHEPQLPFPPPNHASPGSGSQPTTPSTTPISSTTSTPSTSKVLELQPATAVIHDGYWGPPGNTCGAKTLQIYKSPSSAHALSTMLKFQYPSSAKYCWLEFVGPAVPAGSGREVDVFLQWAPVDACPSDGNRRDVQVGRLEIPVGGGKAVWKAVYKDYLTRTTFPCPVGKVEGIELVGVGDSEDIRWVQGAGKGARVLYSN
ncbi:hypothetical protein B0H67DRAFT_609457 [Lasiosphaeris hirsuta]|uniref:Ubiquitin 3 binding protein But2 C-terminal domain-containing protein n=1 Tax=Lasiosphaeris hirsuta TaxID=260670 RepID=A0AA40E383_9PEZI|nr:hypothetical protein B0H67DRAFT_609457 [Lasiosphaeris hirsuta]